jgi:amidase
MNDLDLTAQVARLKARDVSARELVEASIARAEALEPKLNALTTRRFEQALVEAEKADPETPFAGAPFMHKDLVDVPGFARSDGAHAALHQQPERAPPLIGALQKAGLTFISATNTPEFASLPVTANQTFGATANPWDISKTSAGSSGGSAAAVAAGYVAAAHATDGAGSIRMPSSFCGTFGFKPTRERLLSGEADGSHPFLKHHHAITRSVRDSAWLFELTQDRSAQAKYAPLSAQQLSPQNRPLKIGLMLDNIQQAEVAPPIRQAIEATAKRCADLGHEIIELSLAGVDGQGFWAHVENMFLVRMPFLVAAIEQATGAAFEDNQLLSPFTTSMGIASRDLPDRAEAIAMAAFEQHRASLLAGFETVDVLLTPVTPNMPFGHDGLTPQGNLAADGQKIADMMSYMATANVYGLPAMSIPCSMADGLPIGAHFMAAQGRDDILFELAYALEQAAPWPVQLTV